MKTIIEKIRAEMIAQNKILEKNEHYDFWGEHVVHVLKHALELADKYGADREIVECTDAYLAE